VWSSTDGRSWQNLGPLSFIGFGFEGDAHFNERDGVLYVHLAREDESEERWVSVDGTVWSQLPGPAGSPLGSVMPFGEGSVAWTESTLSVSADGIDWVDYSLADLGLRVDADNFDGGFGGAVVGGKVFVTSWSDQPDGVGQVLVFEFDE